MGYDVQNQSQITFTTSLKKSQMSILAKSMLFAGLGFLLVCGFGYLINFLLINPERIGYFQYVDNVNTLNIVSTVLLIISTVLMISYSFMRSVNIWMTSILYILMIATFSISFGFLFTVYDLSSLLFIFGIAGISLAFCAIIGYTIKDKTAFSLMKILGFLTMFYFLFTFIFMMVSIFVYSNNNWVFILLSIVLMIIILIGNISTFYQIRKIDQFSANLDTKSSIAISLQLGLNILISIITTIILLLRLISLFRYNN